jgi:hypothetical protein
MRPIESPNSEICGRCRIVTHHEAGQLHRSKSGEIGIVAGSHHRQEVGLGPGITEHTGGLSGNHRFGRVEWQLFASPQRHLEDFVPVAFPSEVVHRRRGRVCSREHKRENHCDRSRQPSVSRSSPGKRGRRRDNESACDLHCQQLTSIIGSPFPELVPPSGRSPPNLVFSGVTLRDDPL